MTRHVSTAAIARFREGDLRPRRTAQVRAHLAECARCAAASDGLATVTTLLACTTVPPVPEHLAARIHSALATEAAQRIAPAAGKQPGRGDLADRRTSPRRPLPIMSASTPVRALAAAGAVAIIVGGGYGISQLGGSAGSTSSASAESSGSGGLNGVHAAPAAGSGTGIARAGAGSASAVRSGRRERDRHAARSHFFTPVSTGTNFTSTALTAQVRSEISRVQSNVKSPTISVVPGASAAPRAATGTGSALSGSMLAACIARISGGGEVKLVDVARYDSSPATVIVFAAAGSVTEQIVVVGQACSGSDSDVLARRALPAG